MALIVAQSVGFETVDSTWVDGAVWTSSEPGVFAAFVRFESVTLGTGEFVVGVQNADARSINQAVGGFTGFFIEEGDGFNDRRQLLPWVDVLGSTELYVNETITLDGETKMWWYVVKLAGIEVMDSGTLAVDNTTIDQTLWSSPEMGIYQLSVNWEEVDPGTFAGEMLFEVDSSSDPGNPLLARPSDGLSESLFEGDGGGELQLAPWTDVDGDTNVKLDVSSISGDHTLDWAVVRVTPLS